MDWTSWIGRTRSVELDALRLLVLVHRLGHQLEDRRGDEVVRELRGERRAQHLDHLLAHPATLAYVLMDLIRRAGDDLAEQRGAMARRVRWLLAHERRRYDPARRSRSRRRGQNPLARVDPTRRHRFRPFVWRRWDDALATLHSRGLLRVGVGDSPGSGPEDLSYGLTGRASQWLDQQVYPNHGDAGFHSQVCMVISDYLAELLTDAGSLPDRLAQAEEGLAAFRRDQSLTAADDSAPPYFYAAFREKL